MNATSVIADVERRTTRILRSPAARVIGTVVGLVAFAMVVRQFARADVGMGSLVGGAGALGLVLAVLGFAAFHALAVATLHALGAAEPRYVWGISQLVKYLPVPGAAVVGMAGAAVRSGADGRGAMRLVVVASVVRVGGALVVGAAALPFWLGRAAWVEAVLVVGVVAGGWLLGHRVGGARATVYAVAGWVAAGVAVAAVVGTGEGVAVGSAYALAWVVGQLALPVPAGIGVREFAIVALLTPVLGAASATVVAISSRLVHTASDIVVASSAGLARRRPEQTVEQG